MTENILKIVSDLENENLENARGIFGKKKKSLEEVLPDPIIEDEEKIDDGEKMKDDGFLVEEELKKIHSGTMDKKKQKLAEFKRRLMEQKKGIAKIQNTVFNDVQQRPDLTVDEYLEPVSGLFDEFDLSSEQRLAFKKGLEAYVNSRESIKENTKEFVNEDGEVDGEGLYEKLFNRKPQGRVDVILRPAMIYLMIENLDDYIVAGENGNIQNVTDEIREKRDREGGCKLISSNIKGLENAIALEKATRGFFNISHDEKTFKHEEQHIFNEIMRAAYNAENIKIEKRMEFVEKRQEKGKVASDEAKKIKQEHHINISIEDRIKDEISAFFKDGSSADRIREVLLKPDTIYDYGFDYKDGNYEKAEFSQKYIELVENGIAAFDRLLKSGYSVEEAQSVLYVEPLTSWQKTVDRLGIKNAEEMSPKEVDRLGIKDAEEMSPKEKELWEKLAIARSEYAEVEFHERTMMARIRKALGKTNEKGEGETYNTAHMKLRYESALMAYKEYKIVEIESKGFFGDREGSKDIKKELKDLYTYVNLSEASNFYDARTDARLNFRENQMQSSEGVKQLWHKMVLGAGNIANIYNKKVPGLAKLAVAATTLIPGLQAFAIGKRGWGAFMMMAAGGMQIDKFCQYKDRFDNFREVDKNIGIMNMENEASREHLNWISDILDEKIFNIDKKLEAQAHRSSRNKVIAFASAMALGASTASLLAGFIDPAEGKENAGLFARLLSAKKDGIVDHASGASSSSDNSLKIDPKVLSRQNSDGSFSSLNHAEKGNVSTLKDHGSYSDESKIGASAAKIDKNSYVAASSVHEKMSGSAVVDKFDHNTPSGAMNATEQAAHVREVAATETARTETINIKEPAKISEGGKLRHDSFIRSLKDHLKEQPFIDKKEAAHIAELTFHDAAKEFATANNMSYDQAVAKLSRIHPGTTYELTWDENGHPKMHIKNVKFVDDGHHKAIKDASEITKHVDPKIEKVSDLPTDETYKEWNKDVVDSADRANREKYDIASAISRGEVPVLDPNGPNFSENLGYSRMLTEAANSDLYNWGPSYEMGRMGEVVRHSQEHMKSLLDMPDKETFTKIGKDFFDGKKSNILKFGGVKVTEALQNPDENLKGLSKEAKDLIVGYANSDATKPKPNETFKIWSYRIMTLARRSAEQKMAA